MKKTIICVDDEKSLLWGLQQQIKRAFSDRFLIELAESGEEALEILAELKQSDAKAFLLITDEMMPGMKGHQLIENVNKDYPEMKCILLSGYAAEEVLTPSFTAKVFKFIKKPWDYDELIDAIKAASDSP